jgi:hypothetical protein
LLAAILAASFVAVLSNHPQGGFITRKPTVVAPPASVKSWDNDGGLFGLFGQSSATPQARNTQRRGGYRPAQPDWWD